jgi:hypothetical protein
MEKRYHISFWTAAAGGRRCVVQHINHIIKCRDMPPLVPINTLYKIFDRVSAFVHSKFNSPSSPVREASKSEIRAPINPARGFCSLCAREKPLELRIIK